MSLLTIEQQPDNSAYTEHHQSTTLRLWDWKLSLNTSRANDDDEDEDDDEQLVEVVVVIGSPQPPWRGGGWGGGIGGGGIGGGGRVGGGSGGDTSPTPTEPDEDEEEVCGNGYTEIEIHQLMVQSLLQLTRANDAWRDHLHLESLIISGYFVWKYGERAGVYIAAGYRGVMDLGMRYLSNSARDRLQAEYNAALATCN